VDGELVDELGDWSASCIYAASTEKCSVGGGPARRQATSDTMKNDKKRVCHQFQAMTTRERIVTLLQHAGFYYIEEAIVSLLQRIVCCCRYYHSLIAPIVDEPFVCTLLNLWFTLVMSISQTLLLPTPTDSIFLTLHRYHHDDGDDDSDETITFSTLRHENGQRLLSFTADTLLEALLKVIALPRQLQHSRAAAALA
jgi:hypothetical protein